MKPEGPIKPKIAFYWCAACGGCEEAVLDLADQLLDVVAAVDIVFWPVALDFKESDIASMPDGSIAVSFINGAVRTTHQAEMAKLFRRKSKLVVAFGTCSHLGGIVGLANLASRTELLQAVYGDQPPAMEYRVDGGAVLTLPELLGAVYPLDRVVPVDYYVPGCPPSVPVVQNAFRTLLGDSLPERGSVLAPDRAMCEECPRRDTRPAELSITEWRRVQEVLIDTEKCILAQGVPCLGAATRGGCGARCIAANMPCTGCFGPTNRVRDSGGKALCSIASVVAGSDPAEIDRAIDGIPDPVGWFYRYSLAASFLGRKYSE
jgi:F420-non-reducing hydrogenase small subunit